ncbi:MAG: hypothetical protein H6719_23475 [Sandaracinaceae bacterium]|nr:hypothetical protein [Sandaracinaceae bacterium]
MSRWTSLLAVPLVACLLAFAGPASAQQADADDDAPVGTEEPDPTRLDVERLPPEAIQITRDLYAHGFFVEATIGALGFVGGIGDLTNVGPWATIGIGFEIFDFLHLLLQAEGSMHNTNAPPPPAATAFEILGGGASLRLQGNFTEAFAMWIAGQFAVMIATTDILELYGFQDSTTIGISYGGEAGIDWHFRARHHSIGILGGVRHFPSLERTGGSSPALGIHGSAYLRYVF